MTRRCRAALTVLLLAIVACGEAAPATAPAPTPPSPAATTSPPDRDATQEYRTMATVLEAGDSGPRLCHAVAESYPPQCDGPAIVGWDWDAVDGEETASSVTWVDAVLTGTWDGERFTVTRPVETLSAWPEPPPVAPSEPAPDRDGDDLPTVDELTALQDEVNAAVTDDGGSPRDTPLGRLLGSAPDTERGVVVVQVLVADDVARAWARHRWGDRVVLDPVLQPVD